MNLVRIIDVDRALKCSLVLGRATPRRPFSSACSQVQSAGEINSRSSIRHQEVAVIQRSSLTVEQLIQFQSVSSPTFLRRRLPCCNRKAAHWQERTHKDILGNNCCTRAILNESLSRYRYAYKLLVSVRRSVDRNFEGDQVWGEDTSPYS